MQHTKSRHLNRSALVHLAFPISHLSDIKFANTLGLLPFWKPQGGGIWKHALFQVGFKILPISKRQSQTNETSTYVKGADMFLVRFLTGYNCRVWRLSAGDIHQDMSTDSRIMLISLTY